MVDVVIIGGGLSGLAAAVDLDSQGARIALLEQAPRLGGRCYSYVDGTTGDTVENGQHIILGAYHDLLRYLSAIGTRDLLRPSRGLSLRFHHPSKGFGTFRISRLPRPFHLTAGMLQFRLLSAGDRRRLLNVGQKLYRESDEERDRFTVEEWLRAADQSTESRRCFWDPIAVSVMNELPGKASARVFAGALRSAFLGKKSDSAILFPTAGQTDLYVSGALRVLKKQVVRTNTEARRIEEVQERAVGVRLNDGSLIRSRSVISSVPHHSLSKLLPGKRRKEFGYLEKFSSSPIISIHLWFDREFMPDEHVGVIGGTIQWLFNARKIGSPSRSLTAVISAAYGLVELPKVSLVGLALRDIRSLYPESRNARLQSSVVIKERRATYSSTVEIERLRPVSETSIRNFFLAGDWTATGLPATVEGAVRSGFAAARAALR